MKIRIPKVALAVDLAEYAAELAGKCLYVWVNPPKTKLQEYDDLVTMLQSRELDAARKTLLPESQPSAISEQRSVLARTFDQMFHWLRVKRETKSDGIDARLLEWYAEIWSQGPQDTQWTVEELRTLEEQDPSFLSWMIARTWSKRTEHVERKKKA